jgi:hypothetical protein
MIRVESNFYQFLPLPATQFFQKAEYSVIDSRENKIQHLEDTIKAFHPSGPGLCLSIITERTSILYIPNMLLSTRKIDFDIVSFTRLTDDPRERYRCSYRKCLSWNGRF